MSLYLLNTAENELPEVEILMFFGDFDELVMKTVRANCQVERVSEQALLSARDGGGCRAPGYPAPLPKERLARRPRARRSLRGQGLLRLLRGRARRDVRAPAAALADRRAGPRGHRLEPLRPAGRGVRAGLCWL